VDQSHPASETTTGLTQNGIAMESNTEQPTELKSVLKCELFNDHFQNSKRYPIKKAQLIVADVPYNVGKNAYGSSPEWYIDGDRNNGESKLANKEFFDTDKDFRIPEFMHFCSKMLIPEPKDRGKAPCMVVFCSFEQQFILIEEAKKHGLMNYINLVFVKNSSAQVLKANMRIVGNCEYALILYRGKLPKYNNHGKMIYNAIPWEDDLNSKKIHPCLPAGEKVFFNNGWKNIEDVKIGDSNSYGMVISTSRHYADKLIEITCGDDKTVSTWNHPFLIKRGNSIYWINAEQIKETDLVLKLVSLYNAEKPYTNNYKGTSCKKNTRKHKKVISGLEKTMMEGLDLSTVSFGNSIMEKCLSVCRYITKILIKQTMTFPICNLLHPLNTSGITLVADLSMENGKSLVQNVWNSSQQLLNTGIIQTDGLQVGYVKNASLKKVLRQEKFFLQMVGSVKTIQERTMVYNLTIDGIPAFDTKIGVSHNTEKPVKLIGKLIEIFTDVGDVVIDPVAGSASTLIAANRLGRNAYGFEIKKDFFKLATDRINHELSQHKMFDLTPKRKYKQTEMLDSLAT
jgi:site-specific DNA-methyltransferase (adenine-specific)